jgi:hypothetical protein
MAAAAGTRRGGASTASVRERATPNEVYHDVSAHAAFSPEPPARSQDRPDGFVVFRIDGGKRKEIPRVEGRRGIRDVAG